MREILVCFSTPLEGAGLPSMVAGSSVRLLETGVGPVNAAFAVTRAVLESRPGAIIVCGVGGAYPSSGLGTGDVVCASTESYGDLGAESPEGFLDMAALGFPLIDLTLDVFPAAQRVPFATCATCTGTDARAAEIERRTGAAVESMEGAAIVHVAKLMGVAVGEVRGISNRAGLRDRASWRLDEAAAAARKTLVEWIETAGTTAC